MFSEEFTFIWPILMQFSIVALFIPTIPPARVSAITFPSFLELIICPFERYPTIPPTVFPPLLVVLSSTWAITCALFKQFSTVPLHAPTTAPTRSFPIIAPLYICRFLITPPSSKIPTKPTPYILFSSIFMFVIILLLYVLYIWIVKKLLEVKLWEKVYLLKYILKRQLKE